MQALTGGESKSTAGICWTTRSLQLGVRTRAALTMHARQSSVGYWAKTVTVNVARMKAKADAKIVEKCILGIVCLVGLERRVGKFCIFWCCLAIVGLGVGGYDGKKKRGR